jgi:hypothetical protein
VLNRTGNWKLHAVFDKMQEIFNGVTDKLNAFRKRSAAISTKVEDTRWISN